MTLRLLARCGVRYTSNSENDTLRIGESVGRDLRPGDVLAFTGDLGAGKTAFIRGVARGLGLTARVTSPTFTIVNEYPGTIPLFHFDLYRLGTSDELFEIGWEDYLSRGGVCCVEWSENVPDAIPPEALAVRIEKTGETSRIIDVEGERFK